MIRILAVTKDLELIEDTNVACLAEYDLSWYWIDFSIPNEAEQSLFTHHFNFAPSAVEDCLFSFNKPKLSYYEDYNFLIVNALNSKTFEPKEISLFVSPNYIVSYHAEDLIEINEAWERVKVRKGSWNKGPIYVTHQILDKIVDRFFPALYEIEDQLDDLESDMNNNLTHNLIDEVFKIRSKLLKLRRLINSMRDLVYRILNSERLEGFREQKLYFNDIYDYLIKLSTMVESSRDMTSDLRDSYLSIKTNRMNKNMMLLTVITTIFIPLTFIAGVYGMNFKYMPELDWRYGYYLILIIMAIIGVAMYKWFKRRGWFTT